MPPARRLRRWLALVGVAGVLIASALGGCHLWASAQLQEAEQAVQRHDFPKALRRFERCLLIWPSSAPTRLQAARAARRAGLFERAKEHRVACEKHGLTPETALESALFRAQQGDLPEVEGSLQALIIEGHPDAVLMLEALAQGYLHAYRLGFAMASLHMLLERQPDHPGAYFWRGGILEGAGRGQEALADYQRAFELAPHWPGARLRLAESLVRQNQAAEARPHFDELLRQPPANPDVLLGAARCLRALALPDQAIEHLDALLRDRPDHADAWAERGRACSDQGDKAEALRCLRQAGELEPRSYAIGYALLTALRGEGKAEELKALSARLARLKRDEERLRAISVELAKKAHNPALRHEAGMICLRNNVGPEALRWFLGALQDDPQHRPTHQALAQYYQEKGEAASAAYHHERAAQLAP
jgi:tetratricopeptide (TPR) repeat protein